MTNTNTKDKFTATAVSITDKATIQSLRAEFKAPEKVMMRAIIHCAQLHRDELSLLVTEFMKQRPERRPRAKKIATADTPAPSTAEPELQVAAKKKAPAKTKVSK